MGNIAVGLYRQDYDYREDIGGSGEDQSLGPLGHHRDLTTGKDLVFVSSENATEVEVTSFPLERGDTLTDHAFIKPREISLTIFCSNRRSEALLEIYTILINILQDRALLTYVSPEGIAYADLLISSLSMPQEAPFPRSSHISLKLKQLDFGLSHNPLEGVTRVLNRLDPLTKTKSYEYNYLRTGNVAEANLLGFSLYDSRDASNNDTVEAVTEQLGSLDDLDAKMRERDANLSQAGLSDSSDEDIAGDTIAETAKFLTDFGLPKKAGFSYKGGNYTLQMKYSSHLETWYADLYQAGQIQLSSFLVSPGMDLVSCYNLDTDFSSIFVNIPIWNTDSYEKGLESSLLAFERDSQKKSCPCCLILFDDEKSARRYFDAICSSYSRENLSQFFEFDYVEEVMSR